MNDREGGPALAAQDPDQPLVPRTANERSWGVVSISGLPMPANQPGTRTAPQPRSKGALEVSCNTTFLGTDEAEASR